MSGLQVTGSRFSAAEWRLAEEAQRLFPEQWDKQASLFAAAQDKPTDEKTDASLRIGLKSASDLQAHAALVANREQGQALIAGSPLALASVGLPPAVAKPTRKAATCTKCGKPMKGHKKGECKASEATGSALNADAVMALEPVRFL